MEGLGGFEARALRTEDLDDMGREARERAAELDTPEKLMAHAEYVQRLLAELHPDQRRMVAGEFAKVLAYLKK
jgi:hypothetical protein